MIVGSGNDKDPVAAVPCLDRNFRTRLHFAVLPFQWVNDIFNTHIFGVLK